MTEDFCPGCGMTRDVCPGCGWCYEACDCDRVWGDEDEWDDDEGDLCEYDCQGFFESPHPSGRFVCGAVGSEDCDECPFREHLGLTRRQVEKLEDEQIEAAYEQSKGTKDS